MPGYVIGNFFIYSVVNAFTPGPGNILALNTVTDYSASLWVLMLFEIIIATIGTTATLTWVGMGALLRKAYQKYYRVINIVLALILLECVYSMLK